MGNGGVLAAEARDAVTAGTQGIAAGYRVRRRSRYVSKSSRRS